VKWDFALWRGDPGLRTCSLAARGLWKEMLCVMHSGTPYGHLAVNMKPISDRDLMKIVGTSNLKEVRKLLGELRDAGVFSETSDGVIYCRKMVRDHATSQKNRANGRLGGNPNLKTVDEAVNPPSQPPAPKEVNAPVKAESESESESESETPVVPSPPEPPPPEPRPARSAPLDSGFDAFWKLYPRKTEGPGACRKPWDKARKEATAEEIIAGLRRYPFNREFLPMAATWLNQKRWLTQADTPLLATAGRDEWNQF